MAQDPSQSIHAPSTSFNNLLDLVSNLGNPSHHSLTENVAKLRKSFTAPLVLLIVSHNQLHEFSSVDVWVPRALDVLDDFLWNVGGEAPGRLSNCG